MVIDEVGFMSLPLQMKLLKVLSERRIPGSHISLDVRVIFTTSRNLKQMIEESGTFNPDLYDFMCSSEIHIEPLRKRSQDIDDLLSYFLKRECRKQVPSIKRLF